MTTTPGVHLSRRYLTQCYASLVSRLAICSTVGQVWAITRELDVLDALLERSRGEAMTTRPIRARLDDYAGDTDFDRGDLSDDREHMAPAAFAALRAVLNACDDLDRHDLMAAAVHRIRRAITNEFDQFADGAARTRDRRGNHVTGTVHGTVVQAGNIDGGVRL